MKHRATSLVLTGALGLGGLATGLVVAPAVASAQSSDTSTADALGDRVARIAEALNGLVSDGTLTQDQADQVAGTLAEQLPVRGGRGHGGGMHGLTTAAEVLGVTEDELRTSLAQGQSLSDVAAEQGVDTQALIDSLVAAGSERIDEKLAGGGITQAQADERKAELVERVTAQVEHAGLPGRGGPGGPGGPRELGERGDRPSADTTTDAESDATAD